MTKLKVRARAVDMLGRQQIAGIPNAIHELFKNAHDAYAERIEVDFFRRNRLLVIRDDGYGMTRSDVENRWLTLGTESRVDANTRESKVTEEWRGPKNLAKRSIMGEKGIGRLAIAVIAPITLLMTRASRPDGLSNLVVALVHWGLFEQPGIDLSSVDIPVVEFPAGTLPDREAIGKLAGRIEKNIAELKGHFSSDVEARLIADLDRIKKVSPDLLDLTLNEGRSSSEVMSLAGDGYGTTFIVLPVAPELEDDIDGGGDKESSKLERNLLGFSNSMAQQIPVIQTKFRDHASDGVSERIGSSSFFTSDDFEKTDQLFEGEFNEQGQFRGIVSIYGKPREFVCNWIDGRGKLPRCGPFRLKYGYVQGRANETRLSAEDWAEMTAKMERVGGLYIYRDDIRVLPYGNSDVDWLDIEKRRTYSAKDWYFSYRRGFGYIEISHQANGALTEKAGREGFRENLAYRDFRSILVGFFKQLAYEFFRVSSPQGDDYNQGKGEIAARAEILKRENAKADARRASFDKEIDSFFELYNDGFFEKQSAELRSFVSERISELQANSDVGQITLGLRSIEKDVAQRLRAITNKAVVVIPRGLALTKRLQRDCAAYSGIYEKLRDDLLNPLQADLRDMIAAAGEGVVSTSERRDFALRDIEEQKEAAVRELLAMRREAIAASDKMRLAVSNTLKEEFSALRVQVESAIGDFAAKSAEEPHLIDSLRASVEDQIQYIKNRETSLLDSVRRQMSDMAESIEARETLDDRIGALEERNQLLEEQINFYADFAQMGMSVGILQHEFEGAARGIRSSMLELKPWADRNPGLSSIYSNLRGHIEHLDGYLKVLDPLGRRLHRSKIEISGSELLVIIRNVFGDHLSADGVILEVTMPFRAFKVEARSSAIVGAFINLIDNAIYWTGRASDGPRKIVLDANRRGFTISNNGPAIDPRFAERIFEFGETRKPGGRGMGLAISREALLREGIDLVLVSSSAGSTSFGVFIKEGGDE